jgi:hypothetical protein
VSDGDVPISDTMYLGTMVHDFDKERTKPFMFDAWLRDGVVVFPTDRAIELRGLRGAQ